MDEVRLAFAIPLLSAVRQVGETVPTPDATTKQHCDPDTELAFVSLATQVIGTVSPTLVESVDGRQRDFSETGTLFCALISLV